TGDLNITYFNDQDNKIKLLSSSFRNCTYLKEAYLNGVTTIGDVDNTSISGSFRNCTSLEILQLNSLINASGYYTFSNLQSMIYLDLPPTYEKAYRYFLANTDVSKVNLSHITSGS